MKKFVMSIAVAGAIFAAPQAASALSIGDTGSDVADLQDALAEEGYMEPTQNHGGTFGPQTEAAVQSFQSDQGLSSPAGSFYGVAGPSTMSALGASSNGSGEVAGATSTNNNAGGSGVVSAGTDVVGSPYQWGGTTPAGFDCSGFINYAFEQNGENIPRTVAGMWDAGTSVSTPQPGDIVFFETRSGPSHAGIYMGNNEFVHAGSSTGVTVSSLNESYWSSNYIGAKRL
ncbi:C40 family peptidase [Alkalicoccus chagannorensis]|uniref:C40 family peptidase n=1 Tax=Alkalicoccus chagannorensis TaxID=427072 RepID=UPI00041E842E|nr:NlpC/P60 family protein [Alkalicoccus chagannorensis]